MAGLIDELFGERVDFGEQGHADVLLDPAVADDGGDGDDDPLAQPLAQEATPAAPANGS